MANTIELRRGTLVFGALALLALGALVTYGVIERRSAPASAPPPVAASQPAVSGAAAVRDSTITLTADAVRRAGIEVATVTTAPSSDLLRVPGVVQPNAYKTVSITPLTAGRVTRVLVELGQTVRRGELLAEIYSPDLAEARTRYLSVRAELEAHELELQRTEKLVGIGAASRQELEHIHAEHAAVVARVESERSRLALLGLSDDDIAAVKPGAASDATLRVVAPSPGTVTARGANVGLNVDPATPLFTVADLSTVWVVGDLYERDFNTAKPGESVQVTFTAYPDLQLTGKVAYIDPQVKPETRTSQLRVEVPNAGGRLKLGMLATLQIARSGNAATVVPKTAVQMVGDQAVVYVVNPSDPTRFTERLVKVGATNGEQMQIVSGVAIGDTVVAKGSFSLRAEVERLGLRSPSSEQAPRGMESASAARQSARVVVSDQGYEPAKLSLRAGVPATLTFVRTSDRTCGTEVVFPALNLRRTLPLNQPVEIDFTPARGQLEFVCGMNMLRGSVVAE